MLRIHSKAAVFAIIIGVLGSAAAGQSRFSDPNVEYSFEVPDPKWKMTVKPSAANPAVEFVFTDRNDGHLEIRKIAAARTVPMGDVIREQEDKLQFMPGYVSGKQENFSGRLSGSILNFEFVRSGRPMSGRFYFLRSGDTVYLLRFTGFQDSLRAIRNHTDSIARTFEVRAG